VRELHHGTIFDAQNLEVSTGFLEKLCIPVERIANFGTEKYFVFTQQRFYKSPIL